MQSEHNTDVERVRENEWGKLKKLREKWKGKQEYLGWKREKYHKIRKANNRRQKAIEIEEEGGACPAWVISASQC